MKKKTLITRTPKNKLLILEIKPMFYHIIFFMRFPIHMFPIYIYIYKLISKIIKRENEISETINREREWKVSKYQGGSIVWLNNFMVF